MKGEALASPFFMTNSEIIEDLILQIKGQFEGDSSGHDWFHIERVWKTAKKIGLTEKADIFIIELGALLHDIADHKFVENYEYESLNTTQKLLSKYNLSDQTISKVQHIVLNCSFKGGVEANKMESIEGKIVQDADKLDAIGAIGIARTFAFGGKFGSVLYDPNIPPTNHKDLKSYHENRNHTINHFYEKLLKLKDHINTETAKIMSVKRHDFMLKYLDEFYSEWEAEA